jgi:hypothetical protein
MVNPVAPCLVVLGKSVVADHSMTLCVVRVCWSITLLPSLRWMSKRMRLYSTAMMEVLVTRSMGDE